MELGLIILSMAGFLTLCWFVITSEKGSGGQPKSKSNFDNDAWDRCVGIKTGVPLPKSYEAVEERIERDDGSVVQTRKINVWN